jgi:spore germination protein KC
MNKNLRKYLKIFIIVCNFIGLLTITGCWSRNEISELNFVIGAAIDIEEEQLKVIAQIARVDVIASDTAVEIPGSVALNANGKTVFDAIRKISLETQYPLFWGHQQMLLISDTMAKQGITEAFSFFARDHETSRSMLLAVTEEDVMKVMDKQVGRGNLPMLALHNLIENYGANGKIMPVSIHNYLKTNTSKGICFTIPMITTNKHGERYSFKADGMALFNKNKMVGKLTVEETRGLLFLLDEMKGTVIPINVTDKAKGEDSLAIYEVSAEILSSKTKIIAKGADKFTVKTEAEISISEDNFREDILPNQYDEVIKKIEKEIAAVIEQEMKRVEQITKEMKTDPSGFGQALYRQRPKEWKAIESGWCDEYYPNIEVTYDVSVKFLGQMLLRSLDSH